MQPYLEGNQAPPNHFILTQASITDYQDQVGTAYHYPLTIPNARKIRPGDFFIYYRPGSNEQNRYFFGHGTIDQVIPGPKDDATAMIRDYIPFKSPVPRLVFGSDLRKSTQHSISMIDKETYDKLVAWGMMLSGLPDNWLYVLTASGPAARTHYSETIAKPVDPAVLRQYLDDETVTRVDLDNVRAWGALPGPRNEVVWRQMREGDWVLTYWNRAYHDVTRVIAKFENEELATALWQRDPESGETWRYMYLLEPPKPLHVESGRAAEWLPSSYQGFTRISEARVKKILERFGSIPAFINGNLGTGAVAEARPRPYLTFEEQFRLVHEAVETRGYVIDASDLANFVTCLRVKPFVILAGVSGIGKSRLVRIFAESIRAQYDIIPVQPNWTDNSDLFGYIDPVRHALVPGRCTIALRIAESLGGQPYFLCLDEMNLAHVEHYFADFLSVLESRRLDDMDRIVTDDLLANLRAQLSLSDQTQKDRWPPLPFPNNAFVIGTVNMDETTHPFSRKVLDRANTIELSKIELSSVKSGKSTPTEPYLDWEFLLPGVVSLGEIYDDDPKFFDEIIKELSEINFILEPLNQHFAYRVRDEISIYRYYAQELPAYLPPNKAMDYQILQKVLPRLHGSTETVRRALEALFRRFAPGTNAINPDRFDLDAALEDAISSRHPMSARKTALMLDRFQSDGFTSFWL